MSEATRVIYKYEVLPEGVTIPGGAVVDVAVQENAYTDTLGLYVWVEHNLDVDGGIAETLDMEIKTVGTGQPYDGDGVWGVVGTAHLGMDFPHVVHVLRKFLWPEAS